MDAQSLCDGRAIVVRWMRNRCAMGAQSLYNGCEIDMQWVRNRCAMGAKSLFNGDFWVSYVANFENHRRNYVGDSGLIDDDAETHAFCAIAPSLIHERYSQTVVGVLIGVEKLAAPILEGVEGAVPSRHLEQGAA
jgi:hypothetical protein